MKKLESCAVILMGGGARAAYQAGVLKAMGQILQEERLLYVLKNWVGISAGSINAAFCASFSHQLYKATQLIDLQWGRIDSSNIYRSQFVPLVQKSMDWMKLKLLKKERPERAEIQSLFDTSPLRKLLLDVIQFPKIEENIKNGFVDNLAISAFNFSKQKTEVFLESSKKVCWLSSSHDCHFTQIGIDHLMASSAIPILFPSVKIKDHYYSDGSIRNIAPLSPGVHMARKNIIIGVQGENEDELQLDPPSISKTMGVILNSVFFDAVQLDQKRVDYINQVIEEIPGKKSKIFRKIKTFYIKPSEDLARIAIDYLQYLPRSVALIMRSFGGQTDSSDVASYLLFHPKFTSRISDLGYNDLITQKVNFLKFVRS